MSARKAMAVIGLAVPLILGTAATADAGTTAPAHSSSTQAKPAGHIEGHTTHAPAANGPRVKAHKGHHRPGGARPLHHGHAGKARPGAPVGTTGSPGRTTPGHGTNPSCVTPGSCTTPCPTHCVPKPTPPVGGWQCMKHKGHPVNTCKPPKPHCPPPLICKAGTHAVHGKCVPIPLHCKGNAKPIHGKCVTPPSSSTTIPGTGTTATPNVPVADAGTLPFTGANVWAMVLAALALLATGFALMLPGRFHRFTRGVRRALTH